MLDHKSASAARTREERIALGSRMKQLLTEPLLAQTLDSIETQIRQEFARATSDDTRRDVWALMNGMATLERCLTAIVEDGEVALAEQADADRRAESQRGTR